MTDVPRGGGHPRLMRVLLGPSERIYEREVRSHARLLAGLTLAHLLATVVGTALPVIFRWSAHESTQLRGSVGAILLVGALLVGGAYVLVRSGHFKPALMLYLLATASFTLMAPFAEGDSRDIGLLATALIPVVIAATLQAPRWILAVALTVVFGSAIRLWLSSWPPGAMLIGYSIVFAVVASSVLLWVMRHHQIYIEAVRAEELRTSDIALRTSQARLNALLAGSYDLVALLDPMGRRLAWYGAFEQVLGRDPSKRDGLAHFASMHPEDLSRVQQEWAEMIKQPGKTVRTEWRYLHPDGKYRWHEGLVANRLGEPGVDGVVVNIRDVTERKEAEAERRRLQDQLQHAVKMESIGRLAGGVAHDFNNLLTAILGNTDLALFQLQVGGDVKEALTEVRGAALSAAAVTRQLLAFSRKQMVEVRSIDVNELIRNMQRMIERMIREDIRLRTIADPEIGIVRVDPGLVEQAIINLAVNARDAMPNGGELVIQTTRIASYPPLEPGGSAAPPSPHVRISVTDTGTGMSDEVKQHLFEPFFTTKARGKGTGLGLAMTYAVVEQCHGHIEVVSELGKGTTFHIYLPATVTAAEAVSRLDQAPAEPLPKGTETILVVEDDKLVRSMTEQTLRACGYTLAVAENGDDALAQAARHPSRIHLLLTDVVMPGMNGRELAQRLAQSHPETRTLYVSGYSENIVVRPGERPAGIDFMAKPYSAGALARRVREILDRPGADG